MPTPVSDTSVGAIERIDTLLEACVHTQPDRARKLLQQQRVLLEARADTLPGLEHQTGKDYHFNQLLNLASLHSQEYRHAAAGEPLATALAIAEERGDYTDKLRCYLAYVGHLSNEGRTEDAAGYLDRCYRLLARYPDDRYGARVACRHGFLHLLSFGYAKATRKFLEARQLFAGETFQLSNEDHYYYSLVDSGSGVVHQRSGEHRPAVAAFHRAIRRCERHGLRARLPWHRLNLGKELLTHDDFAGARKCFQAVIGDGGNESAEVLAAAYANLSECDYHEERDALAETHLAEAERRYAALRPSRPAELTSISFMRANRLMDAGDWPGAIRLTEATIAASGIDARTDDPRLLQMAAAAYVRLAEAHASTGDHRSAYTYRVAYDEYRERYQAQVDLRQQQRFAAQFKAEQRERENERLKHYASQLQLRALRAQMNPHFLYNALNSIQSFIITSDASTAGTHLAKFAHLMRRSLEYSNRESISLEEERHFLTDYLEVNRRLRFDGQLTYAVTVDEDIEEDFLAVPTMILQPYVENAVEHGLRGRERGHISVAFTLEGEHTLLATVTDDGVGRERVAALQALDESRRDHQSRGTEITESRLRLLTRDRQTPVVIEDLYTADGVACGTRVTVKIPVGEPAAPRAVG